MKTSPRKACWLATISAAMLVSCQKPYHQENELYIFVAANTALPYWQEAKAGFSDAARALGVRWNFTGPDSFSPDEELEAFRKATEKRPAGVLVYPTRPELFKAAIDNAVKAGIPVICIDSDAPDSRRILFIGTDNYRAGTESGRRIAEQMHGKGSLVVIWVAGQLNQEERLRGVQDTLKKFPAIKITQTLDDKSLPQSANDQVSYLLEPRQGKGEPEKVDGILCLEASGGRGAAEALHRLNLSGTIPIVGMDRDPETLDFISGGAIAATIAQKPYTMSFYGLRFLDDLHHNIVHEFKDWRTAPVSPLPIRVDTGTAVIDKDNLAAFRAAEVTRRQALQ